MESQLSILLPTLNERENVVQQVEEIYAIMPTLGEILILDDNSHDGTTEAVESQFAEHIKLGRIRIHKRRDNYGLTPSLRDGIRLSRSKYVGWMDCDLSMPPAALKQMLTKIEDGFDVCIGSRFVQGGTQKQWAGVHRDSRLEIFLSTVLNNSLRFLLTLPISDFTSGFWVARKSVLEKIDWRGKHGEYFIGFIAQASKLGFKVTEIPYSCGTRKHGDSKTFGNWKALSLNSYRYLMATLRVLCANPKRDKL